MRRLQKMLVASLLMTVSAATASAQQDQQNGGNRQFGGNQQDRPNRQNRQFGGNNGGGQDGGNNNGGGRQFGGNNGGQDRQFGNRQRSNSDSTPFNNQSNDPAAVRSTPKDTVSTPSFVMPVMTGPITYPSQPLPKEFSLLMSKSIFSKNHLAVQPDAPKPPVFDKTTVAALVLRGAMREEDTEGGSHYIAKIEDTGTSQKITWVREGALLTSNGARVTEITLDHIVVEKNGTRRLITIGINLDAGEPMSRSASAAPSASATASSAAVNVTASSAGTASDEDVADMMRRRRVQELGQ